MLFKKVRKGYFKDLFGEIGEIMDYLYNPLTELGNILIELLIPILEAISSIIMIDEFRIRVWLYQKQMYFGW